jgi:pimeloyl-ACP methyl ester carboxylesterase
MLVHGYKDQRGTMLGVAEILARHGYGVFIGALRGHDRSDGETITFGHLEMQDLSAWERHLRGRLDLDPERIGIFGYSMGGSLAIQFAAQNPHIKAVVADSSFSSLEDTVNTSIKFFTGLPPFPFAPMIVFWSEREGGYRASDINARNWIGLISPRPVFLMQGGADVVISPDSGQKLFDAAGDPKELWFDPALGHVEFLDKHPEEFERRLTGFYDKYLKYLGRKIQ